LITAIALVAALAGTAVATPGPGERAISKAKVKRIVDKRIERAASGLSVADSAALGGKPASDYQLADEPGNVPPSEPYRVLNAPGQPQLVNNWTNFGGGFATAAFYKDPLGVVHLRGTIQGPTSGALAFTLPPGYRPAAVQTFAVNSPGEGGVDIAADGGVSPFCLGAGGSCAGISLSGITFRAEG